MTAPRIPAVRASSIANKHKRNEIRIKQKRAKDAAKRDERFRRKREEAKDPRLREERLARNVPHTIESKRQWDEVEGDGDNMLGLAIDLERLSKRRRVEEAGEAGPDDACGEQLPKRVDEGARAGVGEAVEEEQEDDDEKDESDADSMLEDSDADERAAGDDGMPPPRSSKVKPRTSSPTISTTSTRMDLTPESLAKQFPTLFENQTADPKILVTTCLNSTLHDQALHLTDILPNSTYVRRSAHRFAHKFSVREISDFAGNRGFTAVVILNEWKKKPSGLDIVHLPSGPMFHFTISNWLDGKKLPGHGNPTDHIPELILNNFRTPLGLLTAHLFRTLFPPAPEIVGRQVVTLHNQRDFIFFRRHRYVFRDKRTTEKSVVGADGKPVKGAEEIRTGLQELGPRFTLKLRRVDKGIQRRSGQEWEWKGKTDRVRTRFQL